LAHLKYLTARKVRTDAAVATVRWLLTDKTGGFGAGTPGLRPGNWLKDNRTRLAVRTGIAWLTWVVATLVLLGTAALILPMLYDTLSTVWDALVKEVRHVVTVTGS
jgi:hypothetical protein